MADCYHRNRLGPLKARENRGGVPGWWGPEEDGLSGSWTVEAGCPSGWAEWRFTPSPTLGRRDQRNRLDEPEHPGKGNRRLVLLGVEEAGCSSEEGEA